MNNEVTKKELAGEVSEEVKAQIKETYESIMHQTLTFMEISFPHEKGDGSENEKRFNIIRSKILRLGNDKIRDLDKIMGKYVTFKLYDYAQSTNEFIITEIINFKQNLNPPKKKGEANV